MRILLLIIIQVALFSALAFWYQQNPGTIEISWLGYQFELSVALFIGLLIVGLYLLSLAWRIIASIFNLPQFFRSKLSNYYRKQAVKDLEDGLTALYAEDAQALSKMAKRLKSHLKSSLISDVLMGQSALLNYDHKKANRHFYELTKHKPLAYIGYYGLARVAIQQKQQSNAITFLDHALSHQPKAHPARYMLLNIALMENQFDRALKEANILLKQDPENAFLIQQKIDALTGLADELAENGDYAKSISHLNEAYKLDPVDFDTQMQYVQTLVDAGKMRDAKKLMHKIWAEDPNEHLVSLYLIDEHGASDNDRYQALVSLLKHNPEHPVSLVLRARFATKARLWGPAHDAINKLMSMNHSQPDVTKLIQNLQKAENS